MLLLRLYVVAIPVAVLLIVAYLQVSVPHRVADTRAEAAQFGQQTNDSAHIDQHIAEGCHEKDTAHYIVTGGAGFIGSALVRRLRRDFPERRVVVVDNLSRGRLRNLFPLSGHFEESGKPVVDLKKDIRIVDLSNAREASKAIRCATTVYHLADIVAGIDFVFNNQLWVFRQNIKINTNTLAAVTANKIPNYVYVGTACSFPKGLQSSYKVTALRENTTYPADPESSYGWSKLMGEYEAGLLRHVGPNSQKSPQVAIFRFHNVYGPGMVWGSGAQAIPALIRKAINTKQGESFVVFGSGKQYRDFVFVDDIVEALVLADRAYGKGVIQIGTGIGTNVELLAWKVADAVKAELGLTVYPKFNFSGMEGDRGRVAIWDRANDLLGWAPRTSIDAGLRETLLYVARGMKAVAELNKGSALLPPAEKHADAALQRFIRGQEHSYRVALVLPPGKTGLPYYWALESFLAQKYAACNVDLKTGLVSNFDAFFVGPKVATDPVLLEKVLAALRSTTNTARCVAVFINKIYKDLGLKLNLLKKYNVTIAFTWHHNTTEFSAATGVPFYRIPFATSVASFSSGIASSKRFDVGFSGFLDRTQNSISRSPGDPVETSRDWRSMIPGAFIKLKQQGLRTFLSDPTMGLNEYKKRLLETKIWVATTSKLSLVSPRFFDVMATGTTLLLCNRESDPRIYANLIDEQVVAFFSTEEELVAKVEYFARNNSAREEIVRAAQERALRFHDWQNRGDLAYSHLQKHCPVGRATLTI